MFPYIFSFYKTKRTCLKWNFFSWPFFNRTTHSPCWVISTHSASNAPSMSSAPCTILVGVILTSRSIYLCHPVRLYRCLIYSSRIASVDWFSHFWIASLKHSSISSILYSLPVICFSDSGLGALLSHLVWLTLTPIPAIVYAIFLPDNMFSISIPTSFLSL